MVRHFPATIPLLKHSMGSTFESSTLQTIAEILYTDFALGLILATPTLIPACGIFLGLMFL